MYRRIAASIIGSALIVALLPAAAAQATPGPVQAPTSSQLTADALPTVQHNGVAWAQVVVGNTVYVGGEFTSARPAGAKAGTSETPRTNLLAYDITTGKLITTFAPTTNGAVYGMAVSPDHTRLYIVGAFTQAGGKAHSRIAAITIPSGTVDTSFKTVLSTTGRAVFATSSTVYFGGDFNAVNGVARGKLGAVTPTGTLTSWAPSADASVSAMIATPDGTRLVIGGHFANINGQFVRGIGAVDATTGASVPWTMNQYVNDYGTQAAVSSLSTDGTTIYGNGYHFTSNTGNFEGAFAANPDGTLKWLEDCHGDTYGNYAVNGAVYTVGHAHACSAIGAFPDTNPRTYHRAMAFTTATTGTLNADNTAGYWNHAGYPSPSVINWFPDILAGTVTGQDQGAWAISGNSQFVVLAGEFPKVNGVAQAGLVRFAARPTAPAKSGPIVPSTSATPTVTQTSSTSVRVTLPGYYDRDGLSIRYDLIRDGVATPVQTTTLSGPFWALPTVTFDDTGLAAGSTHTYQVKGYDTGNNTAAGSVVTVTLH